MTKKLAFLFLLAGLNKLYAQNNGLIVYKTVDKTGTINFFKLYFDEKTSVFVADKGKQGCRSKLNQQISIDDTISDPEERVLEARIFHRMVYSKYYDDEGELVYKNFKDNVLICRVILSDGGIIVNEPTIPQLNWQLEDIFKKINNFQCQKAVTNFRGRIYIAWFCREIPISNGPWKLQGLPGFILEAYTDDHKFYYEPISVELSPKKFIAISSPQLGQKINILEYNSIMKKKLDELIRQLKLASSQRGATMEIYFGSKEPLKPQELNYDDLKK